VTTASPSSVNDFARSLAAGRSDGRIALRPVIAAAGEQPHSLALAAYDQPIAVVFDLMHPVGPEGGLAARVGMQASMKPSVRTRRVTMAAHWAVPSGGNRGFRSGTRRCRTALSCTADSW
jgi:hypothetical protein